MILEIILQLTVLHACVIRAINTALYHARHPLYRTLFANYDYKSHILSATNNVLLLLPALHYATPVKSVQFAKLSCDKQNMPLVTRATVE